MRRQKKPAKALSSVGGESSRSLSLAGRSILFSRCRLRPIDRRTRRHMPSSFSCLVVGVRLSSSLRRAISSLNLRRGLREAPRNQPRARPPVCPEFCLLRRRLSPVAIESPTGWTYIAIQPTYLSRLPIHSLPATSSSNVTFHRIPGNSHSPCPI